MTTDVDRFDIGVRSGAAVVQGSRGIVSGMDSTRESWVGRSTAITTLTRDISSGEIPHTLRAKVQQSVSNIGSLLF